ncbi:MAG: hypothetical protein A2516_09055 [Alphaproteobacteria bacterium RIFOXYD12_FULL_60_8]|nr:MAG: hypothetical protein A2516_09055 [Alphaproteobacteria bacterium RIFOXYD12_FULL_60_8]
MSKLPIIGAVIAILGIAGFMSPIFVTHQTEDVAEIGDLTIQTQEDTSHVISPALAGGTLVFGIVLMGIGLVRNRS